MTMSLMRTHDSFMKIHDRKLHVLVTMDTFSKTVIIFTSQLKTNQEPSHKCLLQNKMGKQQYIKSMKPSKTVLKLNC